MTSSFELSGCATCQNVGHVIMLMLIRIAHVAAIENQGMVKQLAVAVGYGFQLREEVSEHLNVIAIDLGIIRDLVWVLRVV